jgi:hypothetical protein
MEDTTITQYLDWSLTTTRITNLGNLTVLEGTNFGFETDDSYNNGEEGSTDYSHSSFTNVGTLNIYSPIGDEEDEEVSVFEVTFINTGTFNV